VTYFRPIKPVDADKRADVV